MCWDAHSLNLGFAVATFGILTLLVLALMPRFNTIRLGQATTFGSGALLSVFAAAPP